MKISKSVLFSPVIWGIAFASAVAVCFYIRSASHICVGDELRYFYRFNLIRGENYFNFSNLQPVESLKDILDSQVNHYITVNGRTLVHAIEQFFSGITGVAWFYPINTIVFLLTLLLFGEVTVGGWKRRKTAVYVFSAAVFLYLFPVPGRLWLSINLALNYLWPSCAALGWLLVMRRLLSGSRPGVVALCAIVLLSLFLGWSNEAFSLPLSGAAGVWMLLNVKKFRGAILAAVVALWTGALIMLCSPGNWLRADSGVEHIDSFFTVLCQLHIFWLTLAIGLLALTFRPRRFIDFIKDNYVVATALALAVMIGIVAHTASRAFTGIELFSAVLFVRGIRRLVRIDDRVLVGLSVVMALAIITHQIFVTIEHCRQYESISNAVRDYNESVTGTVIYSYEAPPVWAAPFVYTQVPTSEGADYEWRLLGISLSHTTRKPFTALREEDYKALSSISQEADTSSAISPFISIGRSYFAPYKSGMAGRFQAKLDDGNSVILSRRIFAIGACKYVMLVPPEGKKIYDVSPAIGKSKK